MIPFFKRREQWYKLDSLPANTAGPWWKRHSIGLQSLTLTSASACDKQDDGTLKKSRSLISSNLWVYLPQVARDFTDVIMDFEMKQ